MTPPYYVPVLRWKRAEQKALGMIGSSDRERIIPLVELVPRDYEAKKSKAIPTIQQVAEKQAAAMVQNWDNRPIFIDSWLLPGPLRQDPQNHPISHLEKLGRRLQLHLIPVANLNPENTSTRGSTTPGGDLNFRTADLLALLATTLFNIQCSPSLLGGRISQLAYATPLRSTGL